MPEPQTQSEKVDALTVSIRTRWGIVCVGAAILWIGRSFGHTDLSPWIILCFAAVGVLTNQILSRVLGLCWYRHWLDYAICLADVILVGVAVLYLGPGGTIAGFFLVTIPCATRSSRALGVFALCSASAAYLAGALINGVMSNDIGAAGINSTSTILLDLTIFVAVSTTVLTTQTDQFRRIGEIRHAIVHAARGGISLGVTNLRNDGVGQLARSLNELLERMSATVETMQRSANEFVQLRHSLSYVTRDATESSARVAAMADRLSKGLIDMEAAADKGQTECETTALDAQNLQSRAEGSLESMRELEETAALGRARIVSTIESILAMGTDVGRAARKVDELGGLSRKIGSSALSIAKIARHTHVLALNAAIEAARAEEHGAEFAVVADQVRTLAGEAGRSARDVGDLVNEVNAGIAAAASAMAASEEKVADISHVASEARDALTNLRSGVTNAVAFVSAANETSQSQLSRARSFAGKMSHFASTSAQWSAEVQEATSIVSEQVALMTDLDRIIEQLAHNTEMLNRGIAQFSNSDV